MDEYGTEHSTMNRWVTSFFGILLTMAALVCLLHTTRMVIASTYYHQAKYGSSKEDVEYVLEKCRSAAALCGYHYLFFRLAADKAFALASKGDSADREYYFDQARFWCERSLALSSHQTLVNWIKARLLWRESPAQAIKHWENHVAWHFWDPFNHAMLACMYAQADDVPRAEKEVEWVKGSPYYDNTVRIIMDARSRQSTDAADGTAIGDSGTAE